MLKINSALRGGKGHCNKVHDFTKYTCDEIDHYSNSYIKILEIENSVSSRVIKKNDITLVHFILILHYAGLILCAQIHKFWV